MYMEGFSLDRNANFISDGCMRDTVNIVVYRNWSFSIHALLKTLVSAVSETGAAGLKHSYIQCYQRVAPVWNSLMLF